MTVWEDCSSRQDRAIRGMRVRFGQPPVAASAFVGVLTRRGGAGDEIKATGPPCSGLRLGLGVRAGRCHGCSRPGP
jgi:hypothetical protein